MDMKQMSMNSGSSWLDSVLIVWFILTGISVIYVAWDSIKNNPELKVMKLGWTLVTLYIGPIGAAVYMLSCKEPIPGTHEEFTTPLWKQSIGSTIHCMAGDATGIIFAAVITASLNLPMWADTISEYAFGFAFGILIFQALSMKGIVGGSYMTALKSSFLPEWLSMNAVMAGMIPVMVILMSRDMNAMGPLSLRFWGIMSLATLVGMVIAYPVNMWLVATKLKHGMGTVRVLGAGGHSLAHGAKSSSPVSAPMQMKATVTKPQLVAMTIITLILLAAGVGISGIYGNFSMRPKMKGEISNGSSYSVIKQLPTEDHKLGCSDVFTTLEDVDMDETVERVVVNKMKKNASQYRLFFRTRRAGHGSELAELGI